MMPDYQPPTRPVEGPIDMPLNMAPGARKPCPTCYGAGTVPDNDAPCGATITVGGETIECYATRGHPGWPHMAIVSRPCYACAGYDEHHATCAVYDMDTDMLSEDYWCTWSDGDLAVCLVPHGTAALRGWRDKFRPAA